MRQALALLLLLSPAAARADVGPAPECPSGTHRQYLRGNHCVPDGFHLEIDASGVVVEVSDVALAATPEAPVAPVAPVASSTGDAPTDAAPSPGPGPAASSNAGAAPALPAEKGCATAPGGAALWPLLIGLLAAVGRRRERG